jgi:hypothetical protein
MLNWYHLEILYVHNAHFLLQEVNVTEEEKKYTIDLRPFMNPSPYTVQHVSTVHPIHESITIYSSACKYSASHLSDFTCNITFAMSFKFSVT